MSAPSLRPYQIQFAEDFFRQTEVGKKRILGVAPTGAGKTVIGADIVRTFVGKYKKRRSEAFAGLQEVPLPARHQPQPTELL
jgi:ERCC4-related helicase